MLIKQARIRPDETAIVGSDGTEHSFGELNERVNRVANALLDRFDPGASIAIIAENRLEYVELLLAGLKGGMLVSTQNWRLSRRELEHCLDLVDPDAVALSGEHEEKAPRVAESSDLDASLIGFDGQLDLSYEELCASDSADEPALPDPVQDEDGAIVMYTSGTTGLPKGAVVSHRALLARAWLWTHVFAMNRRPDYVGWPPMYHMAGSETVIATILNGGTFYLVDGLQVERILECLAEGDVTHLQLFPATVEPMLEYIEDHEFDPEVYDVDIVGSMANLHKPEKIQRITTEFQADFLNSFGTTETGIAPSQDRIPQGVNPGADDLAKDETLNCQVKLVDEDWNEVDRGEIGEAALRGPTLFSGYINNEEANRKAFKNGWFRLGDLFVRTDDGRLQYKDRRKYLIKSGGENIYPAEIERILVDHPRITEAAVVKQQDDRWGEVPYAYVSTRNDTNIGEEAILKFLREQIASYKVPKALEFVEEERFPRNTSGKIVRSQVEEWTPDRRSKQD